MNDPSEFPTPHEAKERRESAEDVYLKLLGLKEMPETPAGLPPELVLPPRVMGSLVTAIEDTRTDGLERSQLIYWNKFLQDYQPHQVKLGNENNTGIWNSKVDAFKSGFLGDKALTTYHTHPDEHYPGFANYTCFPSLQDMNVGERLPNQAFIRLVGAADGIVAIVQTKQSLRPRNQSNDELIARMIQTINPNHAQTIAEQTQVIYPNSIINAQIYDKMLRSEGFGFYMWKPADIHRGISRRESAGLQMQGTKFKAPSRSTSRGLRNTKSSEQPMPFNRWVEYMKKSEKR